MWNMKDFNTVEARSYLILAALIDQPRHGYAVVKQMVALFPESKRPSVATVYASLERLHSDGQVTITSEEIVDGRARRTFTLTSAGRDELEAEAERMARAARVIKKQLAA
jgi:PadR family transcriptional regulator, regulatory protein PadR